MNHRICLIIRPLSHVCLLYTSQLLQTVLSPVLKERHPHKFSDIPSCPESVNHFCVSSPAITTDVITGFPGETEEEFLITRNFLREIAFSDLHIFPYSPRRGTKAAAMTDQVDSQVKKHRSDLQMCIRDRDKEVASSFTKC